jgi:hypothetical protein
MNMLNESEAMLILKVNGYSIANLSFELTELNSENLIVPYKSHIYHYTTKVLEELYNNYFCNLYQFSTVIVRFLNAKCSNLFEEYRNMILNLFCCTNTDDKLQIGSLKTTKFKLNNIELYVTLNALNRHGVYYNVNCVPCRNLDSKIRLFSFIEK